LPGFPVYQNPGGLTIEPITAYNLIVDSNVLSPSSYGPSAATLGAKFCNSTGSIMTGVWAYIGEYNSDNDSTPGEAGDLTPGTYPIHNSTTDPGFNTTFPHLAGTITAVDFGDPGRFFALEHEAGSNADQTDASRYLGTLAPGECRTEYWLVSYPRVATVNGSRVDVTGSIKPNDDLWLSYFFWANAASIATSYCSPVTMRNEISAMANKIWPNGDNKVPDAYVAAIQELLGWDTWTPNGSGTTAYPGETVVSQGIWYDLGNVGHGFDNDGDLVPDRNLWVQPIGDAGSYDPGCFRLVRAYGLIIVKLNDGTELLIPFVDQMYFGNIPDNNNGAVGLVFYEYIALDGACTAGLTPYQEVASGYDNEKFNADFGAGIPPLQSRETTMTLDKRGFVNGVENAGVTAGGSAATGTINYTVTFQLPDVDASAGNTMTITVGNPTYGMPLTVYETIPPDTQYAGGSASNVITMTNYAAATVPATVLFSTDSGATWSTNDPGNAASTSPDNLVIIKWQAQEGIESPASGAAVTGTVSFATYVPGSYTSLPVVDNTSCIKLGDAECFEEDTHITMVAGNASIVGTVWKDDATGGGVLGNGIIDETGAGISAVTVKLYWDANGDGDHADASDFLYSTTTSNASGDYSFISLPATAGSARYLVEVDTTNNIPVGYGPTTTTAFTKLSLASGMVYGDGANEPSDFGFAPALSVEKGLATFGTIYVGDTVNYTLKVFNNLPGGTGTGSSCTYTIWSSIVVPGAGTPPGGGSANAEWTNAAAAGGKPDGVVAYTDLSNNDNFIGLKGFNIDPMIIPGTITQVQYLVKFLSVQI
jgi:hypothetical protein